MPSIPGFMEYDDDDLTPGAKKEGGLHHNLYDREGKLKGHARFIPDEKPAGKSEQETVYIHDTVFVHHQPHNEERERQLAREYAESERLRAQKQAEQAALIADIAKYLVAAATPHAKRLWREKARPVIDDRRAKRAARKADKAAAAEHIVVDGEVVDNAGELADAAQAYRAASGDSKAQTRYVAALAARAYANDQDGFDPIIKPDGLTALQRTLSALPPRSVEQFIEVLEANPAAFSSDVSTELGRILAGAGTMPDAVRVKSRKGNSRRRN